MKSLFNICLMITIAFLCMSANLTDTPTTLTTTTTTKIIAGYQHSVILHKENVWFMGKRQSYDNKTRILKRPTLIQNIDKITDISTSNQATHILIVKPDSSVWAWGSNEFGQLSVFPSSYEAFPVKVENLHEVVKVAAGKSFSVALKVDGTVWTWGKNNNGQLGNNNQEDEIKARKVNGLNDIIEISSGAKHTLVLKSDGTVWAWGSNNMGQLGIGNFENTAQPKVINGLKNIVQIVAGSYHSFAIDKDGKVYAWGWNKYGQLGDYSFKNANMPVELFIKDVKFIEAGTLHSVALKNDGTVWTWGSNSFNQLGNSNKKMIEYPLRIIELNNIETVSAGDMHNLALDKDGKIWAWGVGDEGRLGNANAVVQKIPNITLSIEDLDEKLKKQAARFADFDQDNTLKGAASLEVYGLDTNTKTSNRFEISVNTYVIDTMYHMIQIGDIVVEGCPTAQALKQLSVQLKSDIDGNTHLSWDLSDNDFYYENYFVEKSTDGFNWKELNSKINIEKFDTWTMFSSIDENKGNGKHVFYRLKHLNCDEDYVYSNIISAGASDNTDGSFKTKFTVSIANPKAKSVTYQLQDGKGNIIKKKILNDKDIAFTDGWDLATGTYYMFLIDEKLHHIMDAKKLVKIN